MFPELATVSAILTCINPYIFPLSGLLMGRDLAEHGFNVIIAEQFVWFCSWDGFKNQSSPSGESQPSGGHLPLPLPSFFYCPLSGLSQVAWVVMLSLDTASSYLLACTIEGDVQRSLWNLDGRSYCTLCWQASTDSADSSTSLNFFFTCLEKKKNPM